MKITHESRYHSNALLAAFLIWLTPATCAHAITGEEIQNVVLENTAVLTEPPNLPTDHYTDGAILGNGDLGVTIAGGPEEQVFYLSTTDFWTEDYWRYAGTLINIGGVSVKIPSLEGASFEQKQNMWEAAVIGSFSKEDHAVKMISQVLAQENLLVIDLENMGSEPLDVEVETWTRPSKDPEQYTLPTEAGAQDGIGWVTRQAQTNETTWQAQAAVATKVLEGTAELGSDEDLRATHNLSLEPGQSVTLVVCVKTSGLIKKPAPLESPLPEALAGVEEVTPESLTAARQEHHQWWRDYWNVAFVQLDAPVLQRYWVESTYLMGAAGREGKAPPGIFFWTTTDEPMWTGDYHLNYNYMTPFYGLFSSNRLEQVRNYFDPLIDFMPKGRELAGDPDGSEGIIYPVGIGPDGFEAQQAKHGQKSNAAKAGSLFSLYYRYTLDKEWLAEVGYPYLREVMTYMEDEVVKEDGRYVLYDSTTREAHEFDNFNSSLALGYVRALLVDMLEFSKILDRDEEKREQWREMLANLSGLPTQITDDNRLIAYAESSVAEANQTRPYTLNWVYPSELLNFESHPDTLQMARDTFVKRESLYDRGNNAFIEIFTIAARLGVDAQELVQQFITRCEEIRRPNGTYFQRGGGIETVGAIEAVHSLLLQSHGGHIYLFPVWPGDREAQFQGLRAQGAFLINSAFADGTVQFAEIKSEAGAPCVLFNPWPGSEVKLVEAESGERVEFEADGNYLRFDTEQGGQYRLEPAGAVTFEYPESGIGSMFQGNPEAEPIPFTEPQPGVASNQPDAPHQVLLQAEDFDLSEGGRFYDVRQAGYALSSRGKDQGFAFKQVDLGTEPKQYLAVRYACHKTKAGRELQVKLGSFDGKVIAKMVTKDTGGSLTFKVENVPLEEPLTGKHDLYFDNSWNYCAYDWFDFRTTQYPLD